VYEKERNGGRERGRQRESERESEREREIFSKLLCTIFARNCEEVRPLPCYVRNKKRKNVAELF